VRVWLITICPRAHVVPPLELELVDELEDEDDVLLDELEDEDDELDALEEDDEAEDELDALEEDDEAEDDELCAAPPAPAPDELLVPGMPPWPAPEELVAGLPPDPPLSPAPEPPRPRSSPWVPLAQPAASNAPLQTTDPMRRTSRSPAEKKASTGGTLG
jgi:hypothetical protein